jgi:hypothetical protein
VRALIACEAATKAAQVNKFKGKLNRSRPRSKGKYKATKAM